MSDLEDGLIQRQRENIQEQHDNILSERVYCCICFGLILGFCAFIGFILYMGYMFQQKLWL
jgi:hypothetical protein